MEKTVTYALKRDDGLVCATRYLDGWVTKDYGDKKFEMKDCDKLKKLAMGGHMKTKSKTVIEMEVFEIDDLEIIKITKTHEEV